MLWYFLWEHLGYKEFHENLVAFFKFFLKHIAGDGNLGCSFIIVLFSWPFHLYKEPQSGMSMCILKIVETSMLQLRGWSQVPTHTVILC